MRTSFAVAAFVGAAAAHMVPSYPSPDYPVITPPTPEYPTVTPPVGTAPPAESTVWASTTITVISCAADVPDCPSHSTVTSVSSYPVVPTHYPTVSSYPNSTFVPPVVSTPVIPPVVSTPASIPPVASVPVPSSPVTESVITISTCVPTVIYSTVTVSVSVPAPTGPAPSLPPVASVPYPSAPGTGIVTIPVGTAIGTATGTGVVPNPTTPVYPPIATGAASATKTSMVVAGFAAAVAVLFA